MLLSAALHAVWSVAIKASRDPVTFNLLQCGLASAVGLAMLPFIDLAQVPEAVWRITAMTSVAHALYLFALSRALETGEISLVYPIARSTPAFMPLIAIPLLGESVSWLGALGIATVVSGMWLVSAGEGLRLRSLLQPGLGFAYLALATTVAYGLFDKAAMTQLESVNWTSPIPRPIFFFFMLFLASSVFYVPLATWRRGTSRLREVATTEWRSALFACAISAGSYGLILEALQTAPVSYVVSVRQSSVLFVLVLGVLRFGERPSLMRVVGACSTVAGVALIGMSQ